MSIFKFPALLVSLCGALCAQTASLSGVVVNSVTGQPISGAHLKLFMLNVGGPLSDAFGAMSGRDGRFSVAGMPAGTYLMMPERTGFVHLITPRGAIPVATLALKAGERITDYKVELTPRAVIVVRVVDEFGDPVPNVMLEATPVESGSPVIAAMNTGARASTNLLGEARITTGPGKYYVKATPNLGETTLEIRSDGTSDAAYGPSWYPAASSVDRAAVVQTSAGADVPIEIRLTRQRSITISGTISGIPQGTTARISLGTGPSLDRISMNRAMTAEPDGSFTFSRLPPAFYRLIGMAVGGRQNLQSEPVEVKPDGPESVSLHLVLKAGAEVKGRLEIVGDPPGKPMEKRTVSLASANAVADEDGNFTFAGVFPERYEVSVQPLPENGYIKSVELDGVTQSDLRADFTRVAQGSRLKITLGRNGAQLSGTVLDKDGQPLGNTVAIVILSADREHISPNPGGLVKEGGKYSMKGIRPGKYILFAIDAFRSGPSNSMEDFQKLAVAAEEIELKAGDNISKDLKVLLKEDVDARAKK